MTAQSPERIILDGRPRCLYAAPLYRLTKRCRLDLRNPAGWNTGNYRGYIGTWEVRERQLYLVQLSWEEWSDEFREVPVSDGARRKLFRAAGCAGFPIRAHWFTGRIRIAIGRRVVYSHHGWSSWFERERVMTFRAGELVRDREVDTRAILEWWLRRNPDRCRHLAGSSPSKFGPLTWFDDSDDEDEDADWWPPDYVRPAA